MVNKPVSIKGHLCDVLFQTKPGDRLADELCLVLLVLARDGLAQVLGERRGRDQRRAAAVIDDLRVDVTRGPEDVEARTLRRARELLADALATPIALEDLDAGVGHGERPRLRRDLACGGLAGFASDDFLGVLDAFALVGLRRPEAANGRGGLPEDLLVDAAQRDRVVTCDLGLETGRHFVEDRVAVAELEQQEGALLLAQVGAIPDAR